MHRNFFCRVNLTIVALWAGALHGRRSTPKASARTGTSCLQTARGRLSLALLLPASSEEVAGAWPAWGVGWTWLPLPVVDPVRKALA